MVEIEIDGKKVEVTEGSLVIDAARATGTFIPHFCYHRKLSIAANCRMCLVEVEKAPKALPACATPVAAGMKVHTHSQKAVEAQQAVMEFLLINHPLDCPICDQGGECQLQDLAVGYGKSTSRYQEEKRVVFHKSAGPLISMEEMTRCIHCTRCVRFGQEIAGMMEFGMLGRGEHAEITTFVGQSVDSEISGNMIDLCPVGALTSKPFRYTARNWELTRHRSIAPHDSLGSHIVVQTKQGRVYRVLPLENEEINECWLSDKDRFSYEALNSSERLARPMIKQGGTWHEVEWAQALEYVANSLAEIQRDYGADTIAAAASPHSTLEELYLLQKLVRGLGSDNIDFRLRQNDFSATPEGAHWLGQSIASISDLQQTFLIGTTLRQEHPLLAARLRAATKKGGQVHVLHAADDDLLMPVSGKIIAPPSTWVNELAAVAAAITKAKQIDSSSNSKVEREGERAATRQYIQYGEEPHSEADKVIRMKWDWNEPPIAHIEITPAAQYIAQQLLSSTPHKTILLGNLATAHPQFAQLHALAQWLAEHTGATLGFLGAAANTTGAYLANAFPQAQGKNGSTMFAQPQRAYLLLHTEPELDSIHPTMARTALHAADTVIVLSPFKSAAALEYADVLLPIAPFTETAGTFVNCEGRVQSFNGVARAFEASRPAWKVLRVLGNMLKLDGFDYDNAESVREELLTKKLKGDIQTHLSNHIKTSPEIFKLQKTTSPSPSTTNTNFERLADVPIYSADSLVRRAPSLQLTRHAKNAVRAHLPQTLFTHLNLKEGDAIRVSHNEHSVTLPAMLDKALTGNVVRVATATAATIGLGPLFGTLTISKVEGAA